jgi:hypothetical protein
MIPIGLIMKFIHNGYDDLKWLFRKMFPVLGHAFEFIIHNERLAFDIIIVIALIVGGWAYNNKTQELEQALSTQGQLAEDLKQEIRVRDGQIEILKREWQGHCRKDLCTS